MLLAQTDQVLLSDKRLAARIDVEEHAELLALLDDAVDLLKRQVHLVAVLRRPAARAVKVAGTRRVKKNSPRHIAAVLRARGFLALSADQGRVHEEVLKQRRKTSAVDAANDSERKVSPVGVLVFHHRPAEVVTL